MNHKQMTLTEVVEYIENHDDPFIEFGIRTDSFIPDDQFNNSWYNGDEYENFELPGVSVVKIAGRQRVYIEKALTESLPYAEDKTIFLLEGECINADDLTGDYGEALMVEHRIVAIINA